MNKILATLVWGGYLLLASHPESLWALSSSPKNLESKDVSLKTLISQGLSQPVFLTHSADGSGRLFVVEQNGRILILENGKLRPEPFLDIAPRLSTGGERGLLGLAFHPRYKENGRYFLNYTRERDGATVIAEYRVSSNPNRSDMRETVLLAIPQPYGNHNGGMIAFGPKGHLFIATGDGGSGGDPGNRAQNPSELLGKFLRIDVDHGTPYGIPQTNPYAQKGGQPEIFAIGFRNPWRFSFDRKTGELWAADVGQNDWEEINIVKVGENHGWRLMEGTHCYEPSKNCEPLAQVTMPVTEYANAGPRCSVIGGYVYRGRSMPSLEGTYLFGDYCSGEIFGFREGKQAVLLDTDMNITSFGEDEKGEVYVINHGGSIHRIVKPSDSKR